MRNKSITTVAVLFFLFVCNAQAQILFKPNAAVQQALQKVITDFPNRLQHITGTLLQENMESSDYSSTVVLPGSENCMVTMYRSQKDKNRSWQAVFAEKDDFAAAKKQYRELFLQVKNMQVQLPGANRPAKISGNYDEPAEQKKFAGSLFRIGGDTALYKNVKVEVALQYIITGWQVSVYVYDKKEDDEILPDAETTKD